MADAINLTVGLSATLGSATMNTGTLTKAISVITGADLDGGTTQVIGSGAVEAIGIPADVTGEIFFVAKNLDATNYVEIFKDNAGSHKKAKLKPGEVTLISRTSASEFYAQANTADVRIQFWCCEA